MSDSDSEKSSNLPTTLVVILTLFGLTTIPLGQGKRPEGTEASAKARVEDAGHKSEVKEPNQLGPLNTLKEFWENCGPYADHSGNPSPRREVSEKKLLAQTPLLQFLIVLVPDPNDTSMSHEFDSTLSAVLRATESAGYVAERYWFPWEPSMRERSKDETKPTSVEATLAGLLPLKLTVGKEKDSKNEEQPGGILCRRVSRSNRTENELLMVLLVPETPTRGVDKTRLGQAFQIVDDYWKSQQAESHPPIRIVGPGFSGSIPSMVMEMTPWQASHIAPHPQFVIYNGAAQNPQLDVLQEAFRDGQVKFRSTIHNSTTLRRALREFILKTSVSNTSNTRPVRRALLVESNTAFGQRFLQKDSNSRSGVFPLKRRGSWSPISHIHRA